MTRVYKMYISRTVCDVLHEIRKCDETKNYSYLLGLVEEIQTMANRMEAKLSTIKDYEELKKNYKDLEIRKDKLKEEIKSNGGKVSKFE